MRAFKASSKTFIEMVLNTLKNPHEAAALNEKTYHFYYES